MWTLDQQPIFGDATCTVRRRADRLRHAAQPPASGDGTTVVAQGREATEVEQIGHVVRDDVGELDALLATLRGYLDGHARTLESTEGDRFDHLVMLAVEADPPHRVGPRRALRFVIRYLKVKP
ncbi:MAG: hypothetical protein ACOC1G_07475 [Phycisphaeraceae bacterium]